MRGLQQIDLSGAAALSGGTDTLDVWIVLSSLLTSLPINSFLLSRWKSSSATNSSGMILVFSLRSMRQGTWRTVSLWKNGASQASNVVANVWYVRKEGAVKKVGTFMVVLKGTIFWHLFQNKMQQSSKFPIHVFLSAAVCAQCCGDWNRRHFFIPGM